MEKDKFLQAKERRVSAIAFSAGVRAAVHAENALRARQLERGIVPDIDPSINSIFATHAAVSTEARVSQELRDDERLIEMERSFDQE